MKFGAHPLIGLGFRDLPITLYFDSVIKSQEHWNPGNENEINNEKYSVLLCKIFLWPPCAGFLFSLPSFDFPWGSIAFLRRRRPHLPSPCGARALQSGREGRAQGRARFNPPSFGALLPLLNLFFSLYWQAALSNQTKGIRLQQRVSSNSGATEAVRMLMCWQGRRSGSFIFSQWERWVTAKVILHEERNCAGPKHCRDKSRRAEGRLWLYGSYSSSQRYRVSTRCLCLV